MFLGFAFSLSKTTNSLQRSDVYPQHIKKKKKKKRSTKKISYVPQKTCTIQFKILLTNYNNFFLLRYISQANEFWLANPLADSRNVCCICCCITKAKRLFLSDKVLKYNVCFANVPFHTLAKQRSDQPVQMLCKS